MIAEDFNTSFISMDRSSRHEIKKETVVLNNTLDHLNLTRQSIPKQQNIYTPFKCTWNILQDRSHNRS